MQRIIVLALLIFAVGYLLRQLRAAARTASGANGGRGCSTGGCGCAKKPDIEVEVIKRS